MLMKNVRGSECRPQNSTPPWKKYDKLTSNQANSSQPSVFLNSCQKSDVKIRQADRLKRCKEHLTPFHDSIFPATIKRYQESQAGTPHETTSFQEAKTE